MASTKIKFNQIKKDSSNQLSELLKENDINQNTEPKKTIFCESMRIEDIKLDPKDEFTNILPKNEAMYKKIAENIKNTGYDKSQPVHIAFIEEEPESGEFLIDGAHRRLAAIEAQLEEIPVYKHVFETRKDTLLYAYGLQADRRNLDGGSMFKLFCKIDELKNPGRKAENQDINDSYSDDKEIIDNSETIKKGKSAEETAKLLGKSVRQVEKMRTIKNKGTPETIAALENDEISIGNAYDITVGKKEKKSAKNKKTDTEPVIQEDNIDESDLEIMEESLEETNQSAETNIEETAKIEKQSYNEGFSDGFYKGFAYALAQVHKGRNPEEISQDVTDFSPSVITTFKLESDDEDIFLSL